MRFSVLILLIALIPGALAYDKYNVSWNTTCPQPNTTIIPWTGQVVSWGLCPETVQFIVWGFMVLLAFGLPLFAVTLSGEWAYLYRMTLCSFAFVVCLLLTRQTGLIISIYGEGSYLCAIRVFAQMLYPWAALVLGWSFLQVMYVVMRSPSSRTGG